MTLIELLSMPKEMSFEEYEKLLKDKKQLENQIRKAHNAIFDEEDSLEILADEVGSERYNKHLEAKKAAEAKIKKAEAKLRKIMDELSK